jgi:hypothetical protein
MTRTSIGAAAIALVAFGGGALATSYFAGPSSTVNAAQPAAVAVPAVATGAVAPLGATALAPTLAPAVPTVQYITEPAAPATRTVVRRAPARTRSVYRASSAEPVSSAQREPRLVRKTRSTKGSVLIIGGSTVGGAGIGAIVGGKKGAVIGGLIGGAAGTVYDRTTRHKESYE